MANEVAQKETFSVALTTQLDSISDALPTDFNKARFVQNAVALLNDAPDLQKYGKQQIMLGLMRGAVLGLDFFNKECCLVPYGSKLQYQTQYTGSVKLAKKYSIRPIKDIYAKLVREGDVFEESIVNGEQSITFRPKPFNNGKIIGAFAVCLLRKHSKASNSPAWKDFTGQMYLKTVLKRLCKHIEIDFENPEQLRIYDEETAIETDPAAVAEAEIAENANKEEFVIDAETSEEEMPFA